MSEVAQAPHSSPDGHIPQLRFPEFNVSWNEYKLGSITDVVDSLHTTPKDYVSSGFPMIRVVDVNNIELDLNKCLNVSEETYRQFTKKYQPKVGDVVLSRVGTCGASIMLRTKDNVCLGQNTVLLHPKINKDFYHILVKSNIFQVQVSRRVVGSTQKTLSLKDLKLFKLNIPAKPEQQKIAAFLTAVDTKIEQLSKKQALFSEYKKGLMQQIFSQAIRFKADDTPGQPLLPNGNSPSGSEFPDWEEKKLGDIGHTFNGLTGKTKDDFGRGKPYIQYMQIFESSKINIDNFGLVDVRDDENQKVAQYGDVFFTTSSETPDAVGYSSVLLDDIDKLYLNSFCFGFRPNSIDELSPNFAQFLLRSAHFRRRVVRLAQGSTRYNMSKVQLMKEVISLPCLKEQTKIANFLSSIDSKIEQVSKQLDESKQFKKALLQQMFV